MAQKFISIRMKNYFFDREAVIGRIEKARLRMLSKAGAYVRTSARSSLRRRKKVSQPGGTPSVHSKDDYASLKNILFAYDDGRDTVIVGPVGLDGWRDDKVVAESSTAPGVLEHGGQIGFRQVHERDGTWRTVSRIVGKNRRTRIHAVTLAPRPFMRPALEKNAPEFPGFFTFTESGGVGGEE